MRSKHIVTTRAGSWKALQGVTSKFNATTFSAECVALSSAAALRGSVDAQSALGHAMGSSGLLPSADVQSPLKIRACAALFFRSLYASPHHLSEANCSTSSSDVFSLECLTTLLCAYGAGGSFLPVALLDPWCTGGALPLRTHASDKANAATDTPQARAWARTMIAGCVDASSLDDGLPANSAHASAVEPNVPKGLAHAELCVLSLCNGADDVHKWLARAPSSPAVRLCISKWKQEVLVAMACAMRIPNSATTQTEAADAGDAAAAASLLAIFGEAVCDWVTMEEVELPFAVAEPLGPVSTAAAIVMSTCFACVGKTADAARIVSKLHHHDRIFRQNDAAPRHASERIPAVVYNSLLKAHMRVAMVHRFADAPSDDGATASSPLLSGLGNSGSAVDAMLDVTTVVGLLSEERKQFDVHAATATSLFALRECHPVLAGDPYVVAWLLTATSSRMLQVLRGGPTVAAATAASPKWDVAQCLREMRDVLAHAHVHSIVAACVPPHQPIESLMVATRDDDRRTAVGVLVAGLRDALNAALLCIIKIPPPPPCGTVGAVHSPTDVVDAIFCTLDALLGACSAKEDDPTHHRNASIPRWKKHLPSATKLRTHKMEVLRDELPQGSLCAMAWLFLHHGYLAHGVALLGGLLRSHRLDLHYYPLHVLAAARSAVRVDATLLPDAADARRISLAFDQRFLLFGERLSAKGPTVAAHAGRATTSTDLMCVSDVDTLVYPELVAFRQSVGVSCVGAMHFLAPPHGTPSADHRGPSSVPKGWKRVCSAVV